MIQTSVLGNQLKVVTESLPGTQSVCIGVLVAASPKEEPEGKGGLAHLTEHSLFLGTSGRNAFEICELADATCGKIGAFTGRDYTCFYAHIMRDYRPFAWDLLGDILLNSTFPEDGIRKEREIILQEIGTAYDHPETRINDLLKRSIWPDHSLGRPVAGDADSVARLTREDVIYFVGQNYVPDRIIVAAVGDIDHDTVVGEAQDSFWRMIGSSKPEVEPDCEFVPVEIAEAGAFSHTYFSLAYPARRYNDPHRYRTHALNTLLSGGLSSRLYTQLRQRLAAVYEIHSSYDAYQAAGTLTIDGVTTADHLPTVLSAAHDQIEDIARNGVGEEELHRTKLQLQGQYQLAADSHHTRMSRLVTQQFYFGRALDQKELLGEIDQLTGEDLQQEAQSMMRTSDPAIAVLAPKDCGVRSGNLREMLSCSQPILS